MSDITVGRVTPIQGTGPCSTAHYSCAAKDKELAELRKDKARLDWLIKQGPPGAAESIGLNEDAWQAACSAIRDDDGDGPTDAVLMRRTIDAAMESEHA
jgi:hypothetical protein